jgi:hypothetical protein
MRIATATVLDDFGFWILDCGGLVSLDSAVGTEAHRLENGRYGTYKTNETDGTFTHQVRGQDVPSVA